MKMRKLIYPLEICTIERGLTLFINNPNILNGKMIFHIHTYPFIFIREWCILYKMYTPNPFFKFSYIDGHQLKDITRKYFAGCIPVQ